MSAHDDIMTSLGRIEGKLDGVLAEQARLQASEIRLWSEVSRIKVRLSGAIGWAAGVGALGGLIVAIFLDFLHG